MGSKVYEALKKRAAEANGAKAKRNGAGPEAQAEVERGIAPAATTAAAPASNGHHEGAQDRDVTAATPAPPNGSRAANVPPDASPEFLFQSSRHFNAPDADELGRAFRNWGSKGDS